MSIILVVDDRPTNRELLVTLLRYAGHQTREASDGAEALVLARAAPPDLVIADILMPTMDGYEFVRQLRGDLTIAATPVIFYSATYLERDAHALARKCGVNHILTKPMEPEAILRAVEEVVGLAGSPVSAPVPPEVAGEHLRLLTDTLAGKVDELEVANQRLTTLIDLGHSLARERDPQRLLKSYCRAGREMIGARYAALGMLENDVGFSQWLTSGFDPEAAACRGLPSPREGLPGRLLSEHRALRIGTLGEERPIDFLPGFPRVQSFLGVPIATATRGYGFLGFGDKLGVEEFSAGDERLAVALAAQLAVAYENARRRTVDERHAGQLEVEAAERRRVEATLRENEERFRQLAENIRDVFWLCDLETGRLLYVSPTYEKIWGRPRDEICRDRSVFFESIHPEDRARMFGLAHPTVPRGDCDEEYRIIRPDGSVRWIRNRAFSVRSESATPRRVAGIAEDITERKRTDEALRQSAEQMEALSRRLLHAQEEERRRIARELHDEVGQCLTAAKIAVDRVAAAPTGPTVGRRLADASELIVRALDQVRDLSRLLRPSVLDDLGLTEAVRALVESFGEGEGLTAVFETDPGIGRLDPKVETACYRIAQEAMTNAVKHAGATRLRIALLRAEGGLELVVEDDGVGFDVALATAQAIGGATLGLLSVRERAALAGGSAEIASSPAAGGTRVRARFPAVARASRGGL